MPKCLIAALMFLAAVLLPGNAAAAPPLADRLPAECSFYAGWAGRTLAFDGSMLGQFLAEPSVASVLAEMGQAMPQGLPADRRQVLEHELAMLAIAWQHRVAFCTLDHPAGPGAAKTAGMILLIDLGKDLPTFSEHLEALMRFVGATTPI